MCRVARKWNRCTSKTQKCVSKEYNTNNKKYTSNGLNVLDATIFAALVNSVSVIVERIDVVRIRLTKIDPRGFSAILKANGKRKNLTR